MTGKFDEMFQQPNGSWKERFEKEAPKASEEEEVIVGSGLYKPYGFRPSSSLESCDIAWWLTGDVPFGQEIQYRFHIRTGYVGSEQISIIMTDCIIVLDGKHLTDLRKAVARGRVTFIQAFNPLIWSRPLDHEPIVEKISLLYPGEGNNQL